VNGIIFGTLLVCWLAVLFLWVVALIKPKHKLFNKLKPRFNGRSGLSKLFLALFIGFFILIAFVAPPIEAELKNLNLEADQEVITEQYTVEGEITGNNVKLMINDEDINLDDKTFAKTLDLQPGDNEIKVLLTGRDVEGNEVEVYNQSHNIYFDYEGMLYSLELEKDKQAEEELQRKLAEVPQYEVVRKSDIENGFSAIVYVEGDMQDYQLSNVAKDLDDNNWDIQNISTLIFSKKDKSEVEAVLEESEPAELLKYVRANFEKRDTHKQLFWFPDGTDGEKLALEVL